MNAHEFEDETLGKAYDWGLVRRFLVYLRPYKGWVALTFLLIGISAVLELSTPLILKDAIDDVSAGLKRVPLEVWAAAFLGVILLRAAFQMLYIWLTHSTGQSVIRDLRVRLFRHLLRLPVSFFDRNPTGRLLVRVTNDIENLNELFASGIVEMLADIVLFAGALAVLFYLNTPLTLAILCGIPLIVGVLATFRILARRKYREIRRKIAKLNAYLAECIQGMRVVKVFARQRYCRDKFGALNEDLCGETIGNVILHSIITPAMEIIGALITAIILWYGGMRIFEGTLTFGTFVAFWYFTRRLIEPLRDLSEKYNILQAAMASSERIFKILDEAPESRLTAAGPRLRTPGSIEFRDVSFSYDGVTPVLQNVTFQVPPGGHVALVGATGSGKTTLVNLILGFYPVTSGQVLVDGRDVRDYDPVEL
ncbi:MAG TPA: ABC transporter transmembrane domain-containing protein, partial [Planctomycetota bacterium]|nr:ABC transporter transmembrane domain-containing protein [Planctomycetota bacterium]